MNSDIFYFVMSVLVGAVTYGVKKGNKIKKRADYILSVFQIIGGVLIIIGLLVDYLVNGF